MKSKTFTLSGGQEVFVYDELFSYTERQTFYTFITESNYLTTGSDTNYNEHSGERNIFSQYSEQDIDRMGIRKTEGWRKIQNHFDSLEINQCRVNLSTLNDKNRIHTDGANTKVTMIYYPNMIWDLEWGGHTFFTDDSCKEIELAIAYVPGRIVIFDGKVPHGIGAPTNIAPSYRYTFVIQYKEPINYENYLDLI